MNHWNRLVKMAVAYIRRHGSDTSIEILFHYNNPQIGINRVFNFQRNITEPITSSLQRIKTNVDKEFSKKLKKTKKSKKGATTSDATTSSELTVPSREVDLFIESIERNASTTWSDLLANVDRHEFSGSKLTVFGQEFILAYNYPYVSNIAMPSVMLVGFNCYPSKFDVEFTKRESCHFEWYRGRPPAVKNDTADIEWTKCEQDGFFYNVQLKDLQHKLKVIR